LRIDLKLLRGSLKALGLVAAGLALIPVATSLLYAAARPTPCPQPESSGTSQAAPQQTSPDRLTLILVGDARFNVADAKVDADGIRTGKQVENFSDTLAGVKAAANGDLAFVNLETVITDRNDLTPQGKGKRTYHFASHPDALKVLIDSGFNLFALANAHAFDYGAQGIEETLYHFAVANAARTVAFAGIGSNIEEATHPACLDVGGARIAFGAVGLTGDQPQARAGPSTAGQASYGDRADFAAVVNKLLALPADYRILSVNYGVEGHVMPDDRQRDDWRKFAGEEKGIDLIVGHHAHVVQGVQLDGKSLIFYSLGNFLHPGADETSKLGVCRDYGLMAEVHLARSGGVWRVEAIEAIPLTNTQTRPEPFPAEEATTRIYALNHLAAGLDEGAAAKGVRFTPRPDGSGLYCADGAGGLGGDIGTLCQGWQPPAEPDKALAAKIASACQDKGLSGQPVVRRVPQRRPSAAPSPFGATGPQ
jgi:Bacterial capsule synthesis protein PGA_cap